MKEFFQVPMTVLKAEEREGRPFITIYATDTGMDRHGERCSTACLEGFVNQIRSGKIDLLNTHADGVEFGKAIQAQLVDAGQFDPAMKGETALIVEVELDPTFPQSKKLFDAANSGTSVHQFSVGGRLNRKNSRAVYFKNGSKVLNDVNLDHITVTRGMKAANPRTHIAEAVFKSLDFNDDDVAALPEVDGTEPEAAEKVAGFFDLTLANRDTKWESAAAIGRIRQLPGVLDESGKPTGRYRRAFLWYDPENADNLGGYKLPIADAIGGRMVAVPQALIAATAALSGSRGGIDIPTKDRRGVEDHISRYYSKMREKFKRFNRRPPWESAKVHEILPDVFKGIESAYFEGETGPHGDGDDEHTHRFTARLNAENGTLVGMTTSWSAGERHAHMVDLVGEDAANTSPSSRGEVHTHALEMPTVRAITEEQFKTIMSKAAAEDDDIFTKEKTMGKKLDETGAVQTTPAPAENNKVVDGGVETTAPEAPAVKAENDTQLLNASEVGLLRRMVNFFGSTGDSADSGPSLKVGLEQVAALAVPEVMEKEDYEDVVETFLKLGRRVAIALPKDRDLLSVRTNRMLTRLEFVVGLTEDQPEVMKTAESAATIDKDETAPEPAAEPQADKPAGEAGQEAAAADAGNETNNPPKASDADGTEENDMDEKAIQALGVEIGKAVGKEVVNAFRTEGLLPAAKTEETPAVKTEPAAEETAPAKTEPETPAAPAKTEEAPAAPDAAKTEDVTEPQGEETLKDIGAQVGEVLKAIGGIGDRVSALEGKPAAPRSMAGQDGPPQAKAGASKGTFSGTLFPKQ